MGWEYLVDQFERNAKGKSVFPNVSREVVASGLRDRLGSRPPEINQQETSLCGPAAFLFCIATDDKETYAKYVIDVFEQGKGMIGSLVVKPSGACKNYMPETGSIHAVDWIALASLRDSENRYFHLGSAADSVYNETSGATSHTTMVRWFQQAGYGNVRQNAQLFGEDCKDYDNLRDAAISRRHGHDVCLLINSKMLKQDGLSHGSMVPDHWVVLRQVYSVDLERRLITMQVFSWGKTYNVPGGGDHPSAGDLDAVLKNYYGYVSAG